MSDTLKKHLESATITFIAFFLMDLSTSVQNLSTQPMSTISWGLLSSIAVAAGRGAIKAVWERYINPPQQ